MNGQKDTKWYVRGQGKTLGPMLTDELRDNILQHSLSPEDEAVRKGDHYWRPLKELNDFRDVCETRLAKTRKIPTPPPVGSIITKRLERRQSDKLPVRPSFDSIADPIEPIAAPMKQTVALAQMMKELREQENLEEELSSVVTEPTPRAARKLSTLLLLLFLLGIFAANFFRAELTRGLKDSHPSDPSPDHSISASDPIYLPKAPVRPNRN